ncbi:MAG TPA: hypothetical protein VFA74_10350 [Terriglobales bacterium]|nr:hypothetical protein [Terriglobales bacterium]
MAFSSESFHVHMIWHNHNGLHQSFRIVIMQTAIQNYSASGLRQKPSLISAECHKVKLMIALKVRKFATVESFGHPRETHVGTAEGGCPYVFYPTRALRVLERMGWQEAVAIASDSFPPQKPERDARDSARCK